jgi:hypothetical protein
MTLRGYEVALDETEPLPSSPAKYETRVPTLFAFSCAGGLARGAYAQPLAIEVSCRAQCGQPDLGKRHFLVSSKAEEAGAIRPGLLFSAAS